MIEILKYTKPYKWVIACVIVLTLAGVLFELYIPTLMANIVDVGIINSDISYIIRTGAWMVVLSVLAIVFTISSNYLSSKVAVGFGRDLRRELFVNVENFSVETYEKFGPAS